MTVRVMAQKSGVTAEDHRLALQALFAPAGGLNARSGVLPNAGIPADLVSVSALQAKVTPFQAWIDGTSNALQGGYLFTSDADVTLTFAVGNGANPRIDLVVARIRDNPYDASGAQTGVVEIVQGVAAGAPVAPAVPASSLALWQVLVPANAAGGNPINFASARTDRRVYTGLANTAFPVASAAERNAVVSPYAGMEVYRTDTKWVEIYDGAAWRVQGTAVVANWAALATQITNPFDGQIAMSTTENQLWTYDAAAWVSLGATYLTYVPVLTQGVTVTFNAEYARYKVAGKEAHVMLSLSVTGAGTAGQPVLVTLPNSPASFRALGVGEIFDTSVATYHAGVANWNSAGIANLRTGGASTGAMGQAGGGFTAALAPGDLVTLDLHYDLP